MIQTSNPCYGFGRSKPTRGASAPFVFLRLLYSDAMNPLRVAVFIDNSNVFKYLSTLQKTNPVWVKSYNPLTLAQKLAGDRTLVSILFYCTGALRKAVSACDGSSACNVASRRTCTPGGLPSPFVRQRVQTGEP